MDSSVDYVLCDTDFRILCAIELDDSTHDAEERRNRDRAVNYIFEKAGLPLIRVPLGQSVDSETLRGYISRYVRLQFSLAAGSIV